jgi:hypothetical protein
METTEDLRWLKSISTADLTPPLHSRPAPERSRWAPLERLMDETFGPRSLVDLLRDDDDDYDNGEYNPTAKGSQDHHEHGEVSSYTHISHITNNRSNLK